MILFYKSNFICIFVREILIIVSKEIGYFFLVIWVYNEVIGSIGNMVICYFMLGEISKNIIRVLGIICV